MCEQETMPTVCESVSTEPEPRVLTPREVQDIIHIGTNNLYALIHSRSFPVIRIGRQFRIPAQQFYAWMSESHSVNC